MSPLVTLTLLGFGTIVVVALLAWTLLSPRRRPATPPAADGRRNPPPRDPTLTNDVVRGARVRPPERPTRGDAFESFLRANDDDR